MKIYQTIVQFITYPSLKRAGLDYEDLSNYRPVYNLSFISKLIEEAILFELVEFFEMIILFPCQSQLTESITVWRMHCVRPILTYSKSM